MGNSHLLFEALFKQPVSNNDTTDYLEKFAEQYPFFTAAHFFLLHKTDVSDSLYAARAAKAALLFNNPFWLSYQLEQLNTADTLTQNDTPQIIEPDTSAAINIDKDNQATNEELSTIKIPVNATGENKTVSIEIITDKDHQQTLGQLHNDAANASEFSLLPAATNAATTGTTINNNDAPNAIELSLLPAATTGTTTINNDASNASEFLLTPAKPAGDSSETKFVNKEPILPINSDVEIPVINDNSIPTALPKFKLSGNDDTEEYEASEELDGTDDTEIEPMNIRFNFTQDIATTEETIVFEPLHTSDYFASLGIKLNEDGKPVDKFGRQLKSFTDWLKTMKKIHTDQLQASTEQADIIIQKMAEKSNTEGDVLTEAMAEVLLHQGKLRKAVELYQKLSLLNPAKSAYFAAKIGQIES